MEVVADSTGRAGSKQPGGDQNLNAEKENLHTQLRNTRSGKRVLLGGGPVVEEENLHLRKKIRVHTDTRIDERLQSKPVPPVPLVDLNGHPVRRNKPIPGPRSWSDCNLGRGQAFKKSRYEVVPEKITITECVEPEAEIARKEALRKEDVCIIGNVQGSISPLSQPLGFTIKLQRHGMRSEVRGNDEDAKFLPAGFFASARLGRPSSFLKLSSEFDREVVSPVETASLQNPSVFSNSELHDAPPTGLFASTKAERPSRFLKLSSEGGPLVTPVETASFRNQSVPNVAVLYDECRSTIGTNLVQSPPAYNTLPDTLNKISSPGAEVAPDPAPTAIRRSSRNKVATAGIQPSSLAELSEERVPAFPKQKSTRTTARESKPSPLLGDESRSSPHPDGDVDYAPVVASKKTSRKRAAAESEALTSCEDGSHLNENGDVEDVPVVVSKKVLRKRAPAKSGAPVACEDSANGDVEGVPVVTGSEKTLRKRLPAKSKVPCEESSWSHPKALKKRGSAKKNPISTNTGYMQTANKPNKLRDGERDNFVKLNINGKGGRRKFVNGIKTKRASVYGRRRTFKKYKKSQEGDEAVAEGIVDGEADLDSVHPSKLKSTKKHSSRYNAGVSSKSGPSLWIDEGWLDNSLQTEARSEPGSVPVERSQEEDEKLKEAAARTLNNPNEENLLSILEPVFGHSSFRNGQIAAIQRVLALQSTLLVLPTGAGKSLCYQLPAYLLPGITLVISPLVALMADQLQRLPPKLPGALINSTQTPSESAAVMSQVLAGHVKVLFISPERLFSESFLTAMDALPKISMAVVDEAHCLSEWSHNFRPSYFRLGCILKQRMRVSCILGLTATATKETELSILNALCIPSTGLVQAAHVRQNLHLSVSRPSHRRTELLALLQSSPFSALKSIIIYCTYQAEADDISRYLEDNKISAKSYHSGKTSSDRNRIYQLFCGNKLRVVVATVAFGMGLDKSDVQAVIHYNMPRSLEHYVQETGRAGRDGKPAYCHLFLDDKDYLKLRSLAHSDGADAFAVNKFLCRVFERSPDASKSMSSINIEPTANELDLKEEVMATILSILEVGEVQYVNVHSKLKATCSLTFYKTSAALLAKHSRLVAGIIQRCQPKNGQYVFQVPAIASDTGFSLSEVQQELQRLQSAGEVSYELQDLAFCFTVLKMPDDICTLTSLITSHLTKVESCKVAKLDTMYSAAAAAAAFTGEVQSNDSEISNQQNSLQNSITTYFSTSDDLNTQNVPSLVGSTSSFLLADIKVFLKAHENMMFTGRAIARIFHGVWSPAFSYSAWCKNHFWGRYSHLDFHAVKEAATSQILEQRARKRLGDS